MVELVNAVGGGKLGVDLNLVSIAKRDDIVDIQYEPESDSVLCFRFEEEEEAPTVILYRTGSFSIAGAKRIQDLQRTYNELIDYIEKLGLEPEQELFEIRYLVYEFDIGREIDLTELYNHFDPSLVEYEPEQFPQLKYAPDQHEGVFMISRTGSIIYTGDSSRENAEFAIEEISKQLSNFSSNNKKLN